MGFSCLEFSALAGYAVYQYFVGQQSRSLNLELRPSERPASQRRRRDRTSTPRPTSPTRHRTETCLDSDSDAKTNAGRTGDSDADPGGAVEPFANT